MAKSVDYFRGAAPALTRAGPFGPYGRATQQFSRNANDGRTAPGHGGSWMKSGSIRSARLRPN
ncbi:protein of unknown function (plasmid) [Cupriavidus taiwanensis]|uniref:Uncharacterized protein n=1 Tax=Cupriavidus taiwanensis TaxID=164546 RepID=A0A9Q7V311_9BURK|nr:protein of unknown function [Cupriavidus taiwanensis]